MLDFTDEAVSITSPPLSSADTQTVSDNPPGIKSVGDWQKEVEANLLSDPETTKATLAKLAPWLTDEDITFVQDKDEDAKIIS